MPPTTPPAMAATGVLEEEDSLEVGAVGLGVPGVLGVEGVLKTGVEGALMTVVDSARANPPLTDSSKVWKVLCTSAQNQSVAEASGAVMMLAYGRNPSLPVFEFVSLAIDYKHLFFIVWRRGRF